MGEKFKAEGYRVRDREESEQGGVARLVSRQLSWREPARTMKNPQVFVQGAGFKPALRRKIDLIRPENALGGFETRPYETVLCRYVDDVFHANFHGAGHPER